MKAIDWANQYERLPKTVSDNAMRKMLQIYPHAVSVMIGKRQKEIDEWLLELIEYNEFVQLGSMFYFQDDVIAMQFKLTWR